MAWGLQQLVPMPLLRALLRPDDLRAIVCGDPDVDVELLKVSTRIHIYNIHIYIYILLSCMKRLLCLSLPSSFAFNGRQ